MISNSNLYDSIIMLMLWEDAAEPEDAVRIGWIAADPISRTNDPIVTEPGAATYHSGCA
jgi:hypothetical protein